METANNVGIQEEFVNLEIGNESPSVGPAKVKVIGLEEREVQFKEGTQKSGKKLVLKVEHPQVKELEIGQVKYESNGKLKVSGLWLLKDAQGKLASNSAIAYLLKYLKAAKILDLKGMTLDTTTDDKGYLVAKAY